MWYLFFQIWVWLLAAFVLGWIAHWFFCCRNSNQADDINSPSTADVPDGLQLGAVTADDQSAQEPEPQVAQIDDGWKPQSFASQPSDSDDLKRIKGVGAVLEKTLNELGIYQLSQIAEWNSDNVSWVDNFLAFPGRVEREDWVTQAQTLASGGTTEFATRVDKGDVDY